MRSIPSLARLPVRLVASLLLIQPSIPSAAAPACEPAVLVQTSALRAEAGQVSAVRVELRPGTVARSDNVLHQLRLTRAENAAVEVNGTRPGLPATIPIQPGAGTFSFDVVRLAEGQPYQVFFTVRDTCGDFTSFVGAGVGTAPPPSAPPTGTSAVTQPPPGATPTATMTATPAGSSGPSATPARETPVAGQTCPAWVHNQYVTIAPDGRAYPTWHPQMDPRYGCYMRHEHGNDPALLDPKWHPPFGYAAAAARVREPHPGFKVYVMEDAGFNGYRWAFVHHFGTGSVSRICTRYHEIQVAVKHIASNTIVADLKVMADHGAAVDHREIPYRPTICPDQGAGAPRPFPGQRFIGLVGDTSYEPWDGIVPAFLLGESFDFSPNTVDANLLCYQLNCARTLNTGRLGLFRFVTYGGFGLRAGANGAPTGRFWTDARGQQLMTAGSPGAIRQFVAPGTVAAIKPRAPAEECYFRASERQPMICGPASVVGTSVLDNVHNALRPPN